MKPATVNFTASVERDLLRRAKVIAAKNDTSVNALFNNELRYLVETFEAAEAGGIHNYHALVDFALGKANGIETMEMLGLDSEEDLFLLMAKSHLPMPRLSPDQTGKMVDDLNSLLS